MSETEKQKRKDRRAREKKEQAALRKELEDFVKQRVALGTAEGAEYEKEVNKRQDAIDEHYATTSAGALALSRKRKQDAAVKSVETRQKWAGVIGQATAAASGFGSWQLQA